MNKLSNQPGFSVIELILVISIIGIVTAIALFSLSTPRIYSADNQARMLVDAFDEARQKALNQRNTFRVEINRTKNQVNLIDENTAGTVADDVIVKTRILSSQVVIGTMPGNVTAGPTGTSPIPAPAYASSTYPLSIGDQKITLRFRRNGEVVDAGTDNTGTGSLVSGATVYVYTSPAPNASPDVIRAVTVLGTTGDTSIYKCKFTANVCGNWFR
jgi:prepilin-type N-terminal cleavage/methylation domain-containing protein